MVAPLAIHLRTALVGASRRVGDRGYWRMGWVPELLLGARARMKAGAVLQVVDV